MLHLHRRCHVVLRHFVSICVASLFCITTAVAQQSVEERIKQLGLIDVQSLDSTIIVDLKYATGDNFVGTILYPDLKHAYLRPHFARKIARASQLLQSDPETQHLRIIIYDAARPQSAQKRMYQAVQGSSNRVYVAHPSKGGRHNFGVAVDLSLFDTKTGKALDMGSPFDHFGATSHIGDEKRLVQQGAISAAAAQNRALLIKLMKRVELRPYKREWWHYEEAMPISKVRNQYPLLNF